MAVPIVTVDSDGCESDRRVAFVVLPQVDTEEQLKCEDGEGGREQCKIEATVSVTARESDGEHGEDWVGLWKIGNKLEEI